MNEQECLKKMVPPAGHRPSKPYMGGVIQIAVTRSCDKQCYGCTQGSNLRGKVNFMTPENYSLALDSLQGYWGVYGMFGGNPALHPQFEQLCTILKHKVPYEQRGIWCNNPLTIDKALVMADTFNPAVSNLNVHLDQRAYDLFKRGWPECNPVGLTTDSRHSPPFVAMKDIIDDESKRWELISQCPINQQWSAMLATFRGELRAYFCEIAGAQAVLHQDDPTYPDTGLKVDRVYYDGDKRWWQLSMHSFTKQVTQHCHSCGIPLQGYGELAQAKNGTEQVTQTHKAIFKPKDSSRRVSLVTVREELKEGIVTNVTRYLQNASK